MNERKGRVQERVVVASRAKIYWRWSLEKGEGEGERVQERAGRNCSESDFTVLARCRVFTSANAIE